MNGFWSDLGIEPTGDRIAIKRAYAARLKVTRPDDNADAYQALRNAYEQALEHARRAVQQPASTVSWPAPEASAAPEVVAEPMPEPAIAHVESGLKPEPEPEHAPELKAPSEPDPEPQLEAEPAPPAWIPAHELASQTLHFLQQSGPDALAASWPALKRELDNLPLWERNVASRHFAQLVIDAPALPRHFALSLAAWFAWESDFRTDQMLGTPRAIALRERLHELNYGFQADDAFRRRYAEVGFLTPMLELLSKWKLYLLCALLPSRVFRMWGELSPKHRYALGIPPPPLHTRAEEAIEMGGWARLALVVLMLVSVMQFKGYGDGSWVGKLGYVVTLGGMLFAVQHFGYRIYLAAKRSLHRTLRPDWLAPGLPRPWLLAVLGFGSMVCGTVAYGFTEANAWPQAFTAGYVQSTVIYLLGLPFLILAPLTPSLPLKPASAAFPAILLLCVVTGIHLPGFEALPWTGAFTGMCWFMASCIAYTLYGDAIEARFGAFRARVQLEHDRLNKTTHLDMAVGLLHLLRVTLGWPYRLMLMAAANSTTYVIAVVAVSVAALPESLRGWQVPFSVGVAGLFAIIAALLFNNAASALMPGAGSRWRGWLGLVLTALWLVWIAVYWSVGPWIDAQAGWLPPTTDGNVIWRRLGVSVCVPLLVMTWGLGIFKLKKVGSP
ncbi:J domain-containing protein [Variovorax sp. V15]|uniref:J domain-containing protein n=1 Tax=Variovorax sp. V15 TaxID=3065952 RepID=UPI0034E8AD5C